MDRRFENVLRFPGFAEISATIGVPPPRIPHKVAPGNHPAGLPPAPPIEPCFSSMNPDLVTVDDLNITNLGPREIPSPGCDRDFAVEGTSWHSDGDRIVLNDHMESVREAMKNDIDPPSIELAGPRREIYFNPRETCIAIVTCGGLCPGINDVIRIDRDAGLSCLWRPADPRHPVWLRRTRSRLRPQADRAHAGQVSNITTFGGSILGTSRGKRDSQGDGQPPGGTRSEHPLRDRR